jgi:hypothetical protein
VRVYIYNIRISTCRYCYCCCILPEWILLLVKHVATTEARLVWCGDVVTFRFVLSHTSISSSSNRCAAGVHAYTRHYNTISVVYSGQDPFIHVPGSCRSETRPAAPQGKNRRSLDIDTSRRVVGVTRYGLTTLQHGPEKRSKGT